jgi:hypothetical protein
MNPGTKENARVGVAPRPRAITRIRMPKIAIPRPMHNSFCGMGYGKSRRFSPAAALASLPVWEAV